MRGSGVSALRGVPLHAAPGTAFGLVGRNGSAKTTLLRLIAWIIKPTSGLVAVSGRSARCSSSAPATTPDFADRENVYLNGSPSPDANVTHRTPA